MISLEQSLFSLQNIPFGIYSARVSGQPHPLLGVKREKRSHADWRRRNRFIRAFSSWSLHRIASRRRQSRTSVWRGTEATWLALYQSTLNAFMELGRDAWREARKSIQEYFSKNDGASLTAHRIEEVQMHLPCSIGDYTDFYASREHATNVGTMFRGKDAALMPNWYRQNSKAPGYICQWDTTEEHLQLSYQALRFIGPVDR